MVLICSLILPHSSDFKSTLTSHTLPWKFYVFTCLDSKGPHQELASPSSVFDTTKCFFPLFYFKIQSKSCVLSSQQLILFGYQ